VRAADEVAVALGTDLAIADGGYDASAVASTTTIDLR
jgi:hypothetical protein